MIKDEHTDQAFAFLAQLIQIPSITPSDGGAFEHISTILSARGFSCEIESYTDCDYTTPILHAKYRGKGKSSRPALAFLGHIDVVPPGNLDAWNYGPFDATIKDSIMYGRGAVDMKASIAAFIFAVFRALDESAYSSNIDIILTADEEGKSCGAKYITAKLKSENYKLNACIVGEPTSERIVGDTVKIGRRGSANYTITIDGVQGHVAYPQLAKNPINSMIHILHELCSYRLDGGIADMFQPSHIEITSFDTGNSTENIIPNACTAKLNARFNTNHTAESICDIMHEICKQQCTDGINYTITYVCSALPFYCEAGKLHNTVCNVIYNTTHIKPRTSTNGGTSDARFIKDICNEVIELGPLNNTAHKANEHISYSDFHTLSLLYYNILQTFISST